MRSLFFVVYDDHFDMISLSIHISVIKRNILTT